MQILNADSYKETQLIRSNQSQFFNLSWLVVQSCGHLDTATVSEFG